MWASPRAGVPTLGRDFASSQVAQAPLLRSPRLLFSGRPGHRWPRFRLFPGRPGHRRIAGAAPGRESGQAPGAVPAGPRRRAAPATRATWEEEPLCAVSLCTAFAPACRAGPRRRQPGRDTAADRGRRGGPGGGGAPLHRKRVPARGGARRRAVLGKAGRRAGGGAR